MLKTKSLKIAVVEWLVRILLGVIFIYASIDKIAHPQEFAQAITNYQIVSERTAFWIAQWLPWLELTAGLSLISGWRKKGGAVIMTVLLLSFACLLGLTLYRGIDIQCGCFSTGSNNDPGMFIDLLRDVVLLAFTATLLVRFTINKTGPVVREG